MTIEEAVFQKYRPIPERLRDFGFRAENETLMYQAPLLDGAFLATITVGKEKKVDGHVVDPQTGDEYAPLRLEQNSGAFAASVKEAYLSLLYSIRDACFRNVPFVSDQANRIAEKIQETYGDTLTCPFKKDEGLVFRNPANQKWYAIFLRIDKDRVNPEKSNAAERSGEKTDTADILNLKVNEEDIPVLLKTNGFYPCYHMNRKHWISIVLDDTLADGVILDLAALSRTLTSQHGKVRPFNQPVSWIIPSNPTMYNLDEHWKNRIHVSWHCFSSVRDGDLIYIYVGMPVGAITYRCRVEKAHSVMNDGNEKMEMTILDRFSSDLFPRPLLRTFGITSVRGIRYMPENLEACIRETAGISDRKDNL